MDFKEIKDRFGEEEVIELWAKFKNSDLFQESGENSLKIDFKGEITEDKAEKIVNLFEELIKFIKERGGMNK